MNFQKMSMLIAGILLLILFILIAISYSHANSKAVWPPILNNCPDYFKDVNGDGTKCYNEFGLGYDLSPSDFIDFKNKYPSSCDKYVFCNSHRLSWDGITYGYGKKAPCDSS
jgi:hypothetical protein